MASLAEIMASRDSRALSVPNATSNGKSSARFQMHQQAFTQLKPVVVLFGKKTTWAINSQASAGHRLQTWETLALETQNRAGRGA